MRASYPASGLRVVTSNLINSITSTWSGKGLRHAWAGSRDVLARVQAPIVILHAAPSSITSEHFDGVIADVRARLPNARVWLGVGGDGWADEYRAGKATAEQVIAPLVACARVAHRHRVEAIIWDYEAAWKHDKGDVRSRAELEGLAVLVVAACALAAPDAIHGCTTYDHPSLHGRFVWRAIFVGTAISVYWWQGYAADETPTRGELPARLRRALASQAAGERAGMLPPDVTGPDVAGDVDRLPVVQLHQLHAGDLVTVLAETELVGAWAMPLIEHGGRADATGVLALEAALYLRREVGAGPGAVARFQARAGLTPDGIVGKLTLEKLEAQRKALPAATAPPSVETAPSVRGPLTRARVATAAGPRDVRLAEYEAGDGAAVSCLVVTDPATGAERVVPLADVLRALA